MKATYYQRGETLDYTATKKLEAGDVVSLGSRIGVAAEPVSAGQVGHVHVVGVFAMTKANTEEIKLGAAVYYDTDADVITATASKEEGEGDNKTTVNNTPAGYAAADAATTATSVLVKLLG